MGKITISEPVKGEALTVTKINQTISSWITESSNVNEENVHDQSLDNYNFADDSVRSITGTSRNIIFTTNTNVAVPVKMARTVYSASSNLDFLNNEHILRLSFLINIFSDFSLSANLFPRFTITTKIYYRHGSFNWSEVPWSTREIEYFVNHIQRYVFDESISYCLHLNNISALTITQNVSNLQFKLETTYDTNIPLNLGNNFRAGVYQMFSEVETIKR